MDKIDIGYVLEVIKNMEREKNKVAVKFTKRQINVLRQLVMMEFYEAQAFGTSLQNIDWCEEESQIELAAILATLESPECDGGTNNDGLVYVS